MLASLLWSGVVLGTIVVLGVVALYLVARWLRQRRSIPPEARAELAELPMSPLQRRAWIGLAMVVLATIACFAVITASGGAQVYWDEDSVRLPVTAIFIVTLVLHMVVVYTPLMMARRDNRIDERDRRIVAASPAFQSALILVVLAAWNIYLTESFRPERLVPTVYLYLMFGSAIFAHMLGSTLGILFGYWSGVGDVEE